MIIIGAGLGGLTAGIALRKAGFAVAIYEQSPVLAEAGAGISLSRAAQSVYAALGLTAALAAVSQVTANMAFLHYRTGALLAGKMDTGAGSGDPEDPLAARQMHRADLQSLLTLAFTGAGGVLHLGHRLEGLETTGTGVKAVFANGAAAEGDLLIGADGLKSRVRDILWEERPARFTGQVAYRFLVPIEAGRPFLQFGRSAVFQGPGRVFNRYTIRQGTVINCVGIVKTDVWQDDGWSIAAARDDVRAGYDGWHPDVGGLIDRAEGIIKWGIFDRPPLPQWSEGPVTLLGDAAHPMLPFLGLGAAMAIEDAMILARTLEADADGTRAFDRYETARRPRTVRVQDQSRRQGELVQNADPDRFDPTAAPSHDPAYYAYDPVTAPV
jgi:salicylate hydroxylase